MSKIFISHSSANNFEALAVQEWLLGQGWDELFLDLDPKRGIAAGERWERSLHEAANRCDAVLFCNKLSEKEGLELVYEIPEGLEAACKAQSEDEDDLSKDVKINLDANGYRLPTEAEWEYAAKAGMARIMSMT